MLALGGVLQACRDAPTIPTRPLPKDLRPLNAGFCGPCKTGYAEVDNDAMGASFQSLWSQSHYSPTTPQNDRFEVGGFILHNSDGSYSFKPFDATPTPCGMDIDPAKNPKPDNAVAWVHVHPWKLGEQQTSCGYAVYINGQGYYANYNGMPSDDDNQAAGTWNLPGYILDADGINRFGASDSGTRYARCGY